MISIAVTETLLTIVIISHTARACLYVRCAVDTCRIKIQIRTRINEKREGGGREGVAGGARGRWRRRPQERRRAPMGRRREPLSPAFACGMRRREPQMLVSAGVPRAYRRASDNSHDLHTRRHTQTLEYTHTPKYTYTPM